jgi:predicted chitinase
MGNGPEASGDGWKFRGRGPIQLTGKDNYTAFAASIQRPDVLTNPDLLLGELAFESALWFFKKNNLFAIADNVEIRGASMLNGILKIALEAIVPEHKKPKKIDISDQLNEHIEL